MCIRDSLNARTGEVTYNDDNNSSRLVSYVLSISCDACVDFGDGPAAWAGSYAIGDVADPEFSLYGLIEGSTVCANVSGSSDVLGATLPTDDACAEAGEGCQFFDCSGACAEGVEDYVGDGYCDDGAFGYYFDCAEFECDGGDCLVECWDGSSACGLAACPEEPECNPAGDITEDGAVNVLDVVALVNSILDPAVDAHTCADLTGDGAVNVLDVVSLVSSILGTDARSADATSAIMNKAGATLNISGNGYIGAVQMTLVHGADFSIDLTDDAMVAEYKTDGNTTRLMVVVPNSEEIFTASGDYEVEEVIVANSNTLLSVVEPSSFELGAAYPNPFNPSTSLSISMPENGYVTVKAYNLVGQVVSVITEGNMEAGNHTMTWDASSLSSGVYLITAEYAGSVATQKVMLMK